MSEFKIGDKVVCINPSPTSKLVKGKEYTVKDVYRNGAYYLKLEGLSFMHSYSVFRFAHVSTLPLENE